MSLASTGERSDSFASKTKLDLAPQYFVRLHIASAIYHELLSAGCI
ncbi:hypothetical protein [Microcoleus sp. N3A4]